MTDQKNETSEEDPIHLPVTANKNIIICSDGTGNRGGIGPSTNVWRLYNGIDLKHPDQEQIAYYDDGVGTDDNKYLKMLSGAMGFGFSRNVKQAYKFLTLNYDPGDDIYLFGFSRGAYTVRALSAFVTNCGIIKNAKKIPDQVLEAAIDQLVEIYHKRPQPPEDGSEYLIKFRHPNNLPHQEKLLPGTIKTIGVWDTVSAVGLPFEIPLKDWLLKKLFKFKFKDDILSEKVEKAYHALAIDDERLSFHPEVWQEPTPKKNHIEQLWFSGVHSGVGGGYPKQQLATVSLQWMLSKVSVLNHDGASKKGLFFKAGFEDEIGQTANVHGKLYDSRSGTGAFYRYAPRDIDALYKKESSGHGVTRINVYETVFDRILRRTENYNPGNLLPGRDLAIQITPIQAGSEKIQELQEKLEAFRKSRINQGDPAEKEVEKRKSLHLSFILSIMMLITAFVQFMIFQSDLPDKRSVAPLFNTGWTYHPVNLCVPILTSAIMLMTAFHLRTARNTILSLIALSIMWATLFRPIESMIFSVEMPSWISGTFLFLLPDILAEAILYFSGHYFLVTLLTLSLFILGAVLRRRYRSQCLKIYEQTWQIFRNTVIEKKGTAA